MTLVIFSYPSSGDHFHKAEDELAIIQILCLPHYPSAETAGADGCSGGWGFPYKSMKTEELHGALSAEDLLRIIYRCHGIPAIGVSAYGPGIILCQHSAAHHHLYGGGSSP